MNENKYLAKVLFMATTYVAHKVHRKKALIQDSREEHDIRAELESIYKVIDTYNLQGSAANWLADITLEDYNNKLIKP